MDHWLKNLLPGIEALLKNKTSLKDLIFVCKDGSFHSFRVLFRDIPALRTLPESRVIICPDLLVSDLQICQDLILLHDPTDSIVISERHTKVFAALGLDIKPFLDPLTILSSKRKKKRVIGNRVPCIKNTCSICEKTFSSAQALKNHRALHMQERPFQCSQCTKSFVTKANLLSHIRLHKETLQNLKPFPCPHCSSHFNCLSNLNRHVRSLHFEHSDKKYFLCQDCGKNFTDPSALTAHRKSHTDIRPYQCDDCDKNFLTLARLRVHRRTHTGEKPYSCRECDRTFVTASQLKSHESHRHQLQNISSNKNSLCPICGVSFTKSFDLRTHISSKHESERINRVESADRISITFESNVSHSKDEGKSKCRSNTSEGEQLQLIFNEELSNSKSDDNHKTILNNPIILEETVYDSQEENHIVEVVEESIDLWMS
ncbi:Gastrula zinc finger protein XlCGF53.1,Oocyte zinc finger protein XlCOF8.4,Oocyte zinc finger protein XlCOF19,Zinc finger protein 674,Zinc finger protein 132,Zinc finger protein 852,Zinc finger protein 658B,Oocyte zinc finger protein XlCOF6,Zinc finger protein with KRAB and SCAN domains 2,Zinc finger protein 658,Zinc finger protein 782,Zinc finger protein 248,Zinc finger protein 808,Zinc finger and SCAN domain-containing protein 29,Zinc finger protein 845 [Lepeophtheirus salmonis]|uniref:C2H2-type domain-containing protein n=1 Tax=Lepeophtheirus salmonis TaxID=72036 RepID=A0A7R8HDX5_LEPSM|nr:Gastrula zinc finger protein XlCGF53.1,Oocyte zinc finger protein XlCOF8.4,Oocyte zinc finger protein XlCOF19,Zinc finger protein 674,Zinc finger protein 132,Zinc finger protein 852,Zinc finger protein 658B,Oocyte zinc finger protein XlCOF6,Zinc finger protein with KRAB and SCAN domains 2,Zinc finger protein 658,Zinc finger protein 782,Zinc finger protein 248,Zinc finger protein 808,Zinc finger and SCAN domain-containing protein 29,Zinc finger protein 845 [Lepeophtheirus salmonis]CAF3031186.1 G